MTSLNTSFEELRQRIKLGRGLSNSGDDPVYYLVFPPSAMLDVKRRITEWTAKLKFDGWEIRCFSMAEAVKDILRSHKMRKFWLLAEKDNPFDFQQINETLRDALTADDMLRKRLEAALADLRDKPKALLLVTDLEALHPYLRVGALEQKLQGKFCVPTVILYPGTRSGRTTLKFLGIYPEDGNYRSIHIGA